MTDTPRFDAPTTPAVWARAVAAARAQPVVVADTDEVAYAGFVTRALAFAIDAAVISAVAIAVAAVAALASTIVFIPADVKTVLLAIGAAAYVVWSVAYFSVLLLGHHRRDPGQPGHGDPRSGRPPATRSSATGARCSASSA